MRPIHLTLAIAAVAAVAALAGCQASSSDAQEQTAAAGDATGDAEASGMTMPADVAAAVAKADTCRAIATEADKVGMAPVQDQWDDAGCESLGADLNAARQTNANNAEAIAAVDHAARPMGS